MDIDKFLHEVRIRTVGVDGLLVSGGLNGEALFIYPAPETEAAWVARTEAEGEHAAQPREDQNPTGPARQANGGR